MRTAHLLSVEPQSAYLSSLLTPRAPHSLQAPLGCNLRAQQQLQRCGPPTPPHTVLQPLPHKRPQPTRGVQKPHGSTCKVKQRMLSLKREAEAEANDVIDLGAPPHLRQLTGQRRRPLRLAYTPNPRLYPGTSRNPKSRPNRAEARGNDARGRRHKRVLLRGAPNPRLYRPAPPRAPRPPPVPRAPWAPLQPAGFFETASRVALRLSEQQRAIRAPQRPGHRERSKVRAGHSSVRATCSPTLRPARSPTLRPARSPVLAARLPVLAARSPGLAATSPVRTQQSPLRTVRSPLRKLRSPLRTVRSPVRAERSKVRAEHSPAQASAASPSRRLVVTLPGDVNSARYCPANEYFRLRSLDTDSSATGRPGAVRTSHPSTAMDAANRSSTSPEDCSDGNETLSAPSEFLAEFLSAIMRRQYAEALKYCRLILQYEPHNATARGFYPLLQHKLQTHRQAEQGGWARGSSSEDASAHTDQQLAPAAQEQMEQGADESSPSSRGSCGSCGSQSSLELDSSDAPAHSTSVSPSRSASPARWDSTGSEPDDNGNAPASAADLHTDNAASLKGESAASLQRLRAQFTCSIK